MRCIYVGIDPGETGAMAVIDDRGGKLKPKTRVFDFDDPGGLDLLSHMEDLIQPFAILEKVAAMPKQGVSSTFKFGTNYGIWQGRLQALGIPFDLVTPQSWQKTVFDAAAKKYRWVKGTANNQSSIPHGARDCKQEVKNGKYFWSFKRKKIDTKAMSLERARRLFPQLADQLALKKHDGRADALLIAEYCRRQQVPSHSGPDNQTTDNQITEPGRLPDPFAMN